jgi:hypothetical protein
MPIDLYRTRWLGRLLRRPFFQRGLQLVLLGGYIALVVLGLGQDAIPGVPELHPRMYTHATTLLFWVVWLMGLVLVVPALGRAWCGVCPLGFLTDWVGRRGLGLAWPRWIRSSAGMLGVFAGGVAAVIWADVHMSPHGTAALIGCVALIALGSAFIWRRSAFCKGLCPVGSVLHLYSRHAPVAVRPIDRSACRSCADRSCTTPRADWRRWDLGNLVAHWKVYRAGCPVALYPPDMDAGACLICLRCVRNCSRGNLGVFFGRKPEFRPVDRPRGVLLALVLGLVSVALLRTWPALRDAVTPGMFPPGWFSSLWVVLAIPLILLVGPAVLEAAVDWLRGLPSSRPDPSGSPHSAPPQPTFGVRQRAVARLPAFVGPVLGAHAALALVKLNAKAAYLPYLAYDPAGASTYLAIRVAAILPQPDLILPLGLLRWLAVVCLGLGVVGGVRAAWSHWPRPLGMARSTLYGLSFVLATGLLGAALVHWLF